MVDNIIICHKELHTYIEVNELYIEFKTGNLDMVGNGGGGAIGVQGGVTVGVANLL